MKKRTASVLTLLSFVPVLVAGQSTKPDATADDIAIFRAVIDYKIRPEVERFSPKDRSPGAVPIIAYDRTLEMCGPNGPRVKGMGCIMEKWTVQGLDFVGALIPKWRDEFKRALIERNATSVPFPAGKLDGIISVSPDERADVVKREEKLTTGFSSFSMPAYRDADHALQYATYTCGGLCGSGWLFLLERTGGVWRVVAEQLIWVS